jgi:Fe/S biogenesis protein NfuA
MLTQLEGLLDELVRPALREHGGDAEIMGYEDGVLRLRLLGHCAGCPAAQVTNEFVIEAQLKAALPGLQQVLIVQEVSPSLLDAAKRLMTRSAAKPAP